MEDIATEAEVGKGTLYRYFDDKEELYLALLAQASQQLLEQLRVGLPNSESPAERLVSTVEKIIRFFDEHPHLLDLIQRAEVHQRPGEEFPWQQTRNEVLQIVQDLFIEGKKRGEFEIRDPELSTLILLGGVRAVVRFGRKPRPRLLARQIVAQFQAP
jgi:AcrR family transcriptional regulator